MENRFNLPESAIEFLEYLHTNNKSPNTIVGYESDLNIFFNFLKEYLNKRKIINATLKSLKLDDLNKFIKYTETKEKKNSEYGRARKVATLKSYFKYLCICGVIDRNIAEGLPSPKVGRKIPIAFTDAQVEKIFNALDKKDSNYYRDKCIVTLLFKTGIRVSELVNIKLNNIQGNKLLVVRKGNKEDCVYLNKQCLESIKEYMDNRVVDKVSEEERKYLFISRVKKGISKRAVEDIMKGLYKTAGLTDKKYVTHTARHTTGTNVYKKTKDILMVAKVLGHENINTSKIYITIDEDDVKNIMEDL